MPKIYIMDSFLFYGDYKAQIATDNLLQIIGGNMAILDSIQSAAVEECTSYLKNKYDISQALQPTTKHDKTKTYNAGQTVYLNAQEYEANKTYTLGSLVVYQGNVYKCTTAITTIEPFKLSHWTLIAPQYTTYFAITTQDKFDYKKLYSVGNKVFWKDKIYTCKQNTQILDHQAQLNLGVAISSPIANVFPDDVSLGVQFWGAGEAYSVPATTEITNTTYWQQGDSRDQKLLQVCVDIALFHAHSRISPRNIPELRITRYMGDANDRETRGQRILYPTYSALGWLQSAMIGDDITPNMPVIQPDKGKRIRWGSNVKNQNTY